MTTLYVQTNPNKLMVRLCRIESCCVYVGICLALLFVVVLLSIVYVLLVFTTESSVHSLRFSFEIATSNQSRFVNRCTTI